MNRRLVGLCLPWSAGTWRGLDVYPRVLPRIPSAVGQRCREEPELQGCGFNVEHPLAPEADTFAGSQGGVAGAQGENTSCLRAFGWRSGKGASGSVGCAPRRRETGRKARASGRKGRKSERCLELTNILPGQSTVSSRHPATPRCQADTAECQRCRLRPGLHSESGHVFPK